MLDPSECQSLIEIVNLQRVEVKDADYWLRIRAKLQELRDGVDDEGDPDDNYEGDI